MENEKIDEVLADLTKRVIHLERRAGIIRQAVHNLEAALETFTRVLNENIY